MIDRRVWLTSAAAVAASLTLPRYVAGAESPAHASSSAPGAPPGAPGAPAGSSAPALRVLRLVGDDSIELQSGATQGVVRLGQRFGDWTLMQILSRDELLVVLEDFLHLDGPMLFVNGTGIASKWIKTAESSGAKDRNHFLGHSLQEVRDNPHDILAEQILAAAGDPDYTTVADVFPPITKVAGDVFSFVGTPGTVDKIAFTYGGRTANFDPAVYQPSIEQIRADGRVEHGLLGGYLPVMRFVYPEHDDSWTEMLAFAPFNIVNGNLRFQPVWYRVCRIEAGALAWCRYVDSYHPTPPRDKEEPQRFYADLAELKVRWDRALEGAMSIDVPDVRVVNMTKFSLIRAMMTRQAGAPKYGVVDKNYGNTEHDGFQDTFTAETEAMLEWGLMERAASYIDNYFGGYVRDDGSILYRGPETGQFGRMLTVVAKYAVSGGDARLLLKHRARIDAVTRNLLALRAKALLLPPNDPAYGMISGWSEADSCLEKDPSRYDQPYFSNSAEAARGFRDLGQQWELIGKEQADAELSAWGQRLQRESTQLAQDMQRSIARSQLVRDGETIIPSIAGVSEPEHIAVPRDNSDAQYRGYRAYMELLHSGMLNAKQIARITDYRNHHFDVLLAVPTAYAYNTREMAGFLAYGNGYGLIQIGRIREALLLTYSMMAHQNTRGMWLAPETRKPMSTDEAAPYCSPAQVVVPLLWRWLLVFEDPQSETLWLGKGVPREWLQAGKRIQVEDAPTQWGRVGFSIDTHDAHRIEAVVRAPASGFACETKLCLRAGAGARIRGVMMNGRAWKRFDAAAGVITIPAGVPGETRIVTNWG